LQATKELRNVITRPEIALDAGDIDLAELKLLGLYLAHRFFSTKF
jgi:hypothetical protein